MVLLSSLQLQLDNLQIIFEEEILREGNMEKIKQLFLQIKGLHKLIAERKALLDGQVK